ncbi:hypothetical protein NDU88_008623 [Pleurodeles waltl]|uniref:Uncharacterized protein n=1 Tax=Pleurodeles waltl TaxID=8319 RepID=A0AAV7NWK1_PLEWA|nr:hypothetical protein NDU88_008621 [Pleurodeles waltl]KAJ1120458.1 hypothetical protein NDU88_008623 [Pleurodeles waltl]
MGPGDPWSAGAQGEHQQPVKGVAIVPRGSACEERLTPRWGPRSRARFENHWGPGSGTWRGHEVRPLALRLVVWCTALGVFACSRRLIKCAPWARTEQTRECSKHGWINTQRRVQERVCKKIPLASRRRERSPPGRKSWLLLSLQIAAIAVDVNLLRDDLRVVAERLVATELKVTCMQSDVDTLKASVAILEGTTHKLEARVEDAEDRARRCSGLPRRSRGANVEAFLEDWIRKSLPAASLPAVFVVERAHRALAPGAPP